MKDEAIKYFNMSLEQDTEDTTTHSNFGVLFILKREYEIALKFFLKALSLDPQNNNAKLHLSFCYYKMGDYNNAIKFVDQCLSVMIDYSVKKKKNTIFFYLFSFYSVRHSSEVSHSQRNGLCERISTPHVQM